MQSKIQISCICPRHIKDYHHWKNFNHCLNRLTHSSTPVTLVFFSNWFFVQPLTQENFFHDWALADCPYDKHFMSKHCQHVFHHRCMNRFWFLPFTCDRHEERPICEFNHNMHKSGWCSMCVTFMKSNSENVATS